MKHTLVSRDSKGKIRVIKLSCEKVNCEYIIKRESGLLNGKMTQQPMLVITKGKVKRTIDEQAELEYKALIKKQLDKGYVDAGDKSLTEDALKEVLPIEKRAQSGALKPMLCKLLDKTNTKLTNKKWFGSYKIDGVRALIYYDNGVIKTASRGGQNYDIPATYILQDLYLKQIFDTYPTIVLDGEIYRHGWPLNKISGLCRKEELEANHSELKFFCYDIADESKTFNDRYSLLTSIKSQCPNGSKIVFVNHYEVNNLNEIQSLHDKAVSEHYEGLVIRDPDKPYKCGGRDNRMLKLKEFTDDDFIIKGLSEGLRDEDLCFVMETKDGYEFKAKPMGDRNDKQWYREHISELIGQQGIVKYFGYTKTDKPVPNLPVFKSLRTKEDI